MAKTGSDVGGSRTNESAPSELVDARKNPSVLFKLPGREFTQFFATEPCRPSRLSIGLVRFSPGSGHAAHVHLLEEEVAYVVSGYGEMRSSAGSVPLEPGSAIFMPPGVEHSCLVGLRQPLVLVVAYSPPVVPGSHDPLS